MGWTAPIFSFSCPHFRIRQTEAKALRNLRGRRTGAHAYAFRPVSEGDLPLIRNWLCLPHVARWWSDADKQIAELRRTLVDQGFDAHLMLLDDRPVRYLQSYDASPGAKGTAPYGRPALVASICSLVKSGRSARDMDRHLCGTLPGSSWRLLGSGR